MNHWTDYLVIVLYFCVLLIIGWWFSRKKGNAENYLLGGRGMPAWAIGIACVMSLLSSISIVMVPGEIFNHGITLFLIPQALSLLSIPCYLLFVRFYFKLGSFTPYEYLEYRYDGKVRTVIAVSSFYLRVMYLAMVLYATSQIFATAYGWPNWLTILLAGVIGLICTWLGGSKAVIWTDVFQFFVLAGGFAAIVVLLCLKIDGGILAAVSVAWENGRGAPQFTEKSFYSFTPYVRLLFWLMLWNAFAAPLTNACSDQITIQRLLSTRNWKEGFKSQIYSYFLGLPFVAVLWFVGWALFTFYHQNPGELPGKMAADSVFFYFMTHHLPSPLPGLFMAGLLAAVMSTISSGMNSMAAVWLKEIHARFINKKMTGDDEVRISRRATLGIGTFACLLSWLLCASGQWLSQSLAEVGTIFYLLGASILPTFLLAVFSKRASSKLIWGFTFFAIAEGIGMNVWYALSNHVVQTWKAGEPLGWGGPVSWWLFVLPLTFAVLLGLPNLSRSCRQTRWGKILGLCSIAFLGFSQAMFIWYIYSHYFIGAEPLARSFTFTPPFSLIEVLLIVRFFPVQPEKKWRGLTLSTINEKIITD